VARAARLDSIVQAVSGMALASGDAKAPKLMPCRRSITASGYLMAYGAAVALERRAREGGSWLVRVALARVGRWIADRGMVAASGVAADVPAAELAGYCAEMESPIGRAALSRPGDPALAHARSLEPAGRCRWDASRRMADREQ